MAKPITASMVKELRDRTGIGMSKCKQALEESKGDMDLAIENLRKSGEASAVKKEGRTTKEGLIGAAENQEAIALIEINAETDFVVKNERFQEFLTALANQAVSTTPATLEDFLQQKSSHENMTIEQYRASLVNTIGENIQIKRLKIFQKNSNHSFGVYSHLGGKIVAVVEVSGANNEEAFAREVAMHVAAAAPEYLSPETVPEQVIAQERDIAKSQVEGKKPENIIDKIVEGKLKSFFNATCLLQQKFIKDEELSIEELVDRKAKETGKPLSITSFLRWNVGQ